MGRGDAAAGKRSEQYKLEKDERFSAMFKDPRFQSFPKKQHKVVIDERFAGILQNEDFQVTTVVDKRGRKVSKKRDNEDLKRYYRLKDEDEWRSEQAVVNKDAGADDKAEEETILVNAKAKGAHSSGNAKKSPHQAQHKKKSQIAEKQLQPTQKKQIGAQHPQHEKKHKKGTQLQDAPTVAPGKQATAVTAATAAAKAQRHSKHAEFSDGDGEEDEDNDKEEEEEEGMDSEDEEGLDSGDGDAAGDKPNPAYLWARARGLAGPDSSDEEGGDDEDGREEEEEEDLDSADEPLSDDEDKASVQSMDSEEWGVGAYARDPDKDATLVSLENETRRLAVVDLDWDHVKAVDILAVLRSFCPRGGRVDRVTVYPSDYGLQRLAEEKVAGPQIIYKSKSKSALTNGTNPTPPGSAAGKAVADSQDQGNGKGGDKSHRDTTLHKSGKDKGTAGNGGTEEEVDNDNDIVNGPDNDSDAVVDDASDDDADEDGGGMDDSDSVDDDDDESDDDEDDEDLEGQEGVASDGSDDESGEVDKMRLAMYERSKMRYYYAIAECDTVAAAAAVYKECDGLEFERSACKFDVRFVPDDQDFSGRAIRDTATSIPDEYQPPSIFNTSLQHTDPKLTWDADDDGRKRALSKRLTEEELKDADFAAYLGSDDSGDEREGAATKTEDADALRKKYQSLLLGANTKGSLAQRAGGKSWADGNEAGASGSEDEEDGEQNPGTSRVQNDEGMEMEITFQPGLESLGQRILDKKQEEQQRQGETVWEAYLRKRREKRAKKKLERKNKAENSTDDDDSEPASADDLYEDTGKAGADPFFQHDDDPFSDPFFQDDNGDTAEAELLNAKNSTARTATKKKDKSDKSKKHKEQADAQQQKKELELLLMDDAALHEVARGRVGLLKGATAPSEEPQPEAHNGKLSKKERRRQKQQARQKAREGSDEEDLQDDGFQVNLEDPRFKDILTSHHFALDPTDPRFKKSKGAQAVMEATRKRAKARDDAPKDDRGGNKGAKEAKELSAGADREGVELRAMVAKLKRKSAQQHSEPAQNGRATKQHRVG